MTKNIQDLSLLLAQHFLDIEIDQSLFEINDKLIDEHVNQIGLYSKYLGLLHDSWILKANFNSKKFSLLLNDFTTHVFADAIVEKHNLDVDDDKLIFPIQLDFEISDLTFNIVDDEGNIKQTKRTRIDEYLYDQILKVDNKDIYIGLIVWKSNKTIPGKQFLILMTAQNILLEEHQKKAWNNLFGDKYDNCYNYFRTQFYKGRYLSDFTESKKLVDEFYANN